MLHARPALRRLRLEPERRGTAADVLPRAPASTTITTSTTAVAAAIVTAALAASIAAAALLSTAIAAASRTPTPAAATVATAVAASNARGAATSGSSPHERNRVGGVAIGRLRRDCACLQIHHWSRRERPRTWRATAKGGRRRRPRRRRRRRRDCRCTTGQVQARWTMDCDGRISRLPGGRRRQRRRRRRGPGLETGCQERWRAEGRCHEGMRQTIGRRSAEGMAARAATLYDLAVVRDEWAVLQDGNGRRADGAAAQSQAIASDSSPRDVALAVSSLEINSFDVLRYNLRQHNTEHRVHITQST